MSHRAIARKLTEYVIGDLPGEDAERIRLHLLECRSCADEVEELRARCDMVRQAVNNPQVQQDRKYWEAFPDKVMTSIEAPGIGRRTLVNRFRSFVDSLELRPVRYGAALGGAIALLLVGFNVWKYAMAPDAEPRTTPAEQALTEQTAQVPAEQVGEYFRKSRLLLVGLSNLPPDSGTPIDLSVERKTSLKLAEESERLRLQLIDPRSMHLLRDMEKVFIQLAKVDPHGSMREVQLIREGIQRDNLLFKVRMAESLYKQAAYRPESETPER